MFRKWIKTILLILGIVSLVLIVKNIGKTFWQDQTYTNTVLNFQKDQDIFPYRIRNLWWNETIIGKSIIERSVDILWKGTYFYLPLIFLLIFIMRKKWLVISLITIGLILISIEKDPNPGKYLLWLTPLYILGFLK